MKRVADKQLSRDDDNEEDNGEEVGTGFKKADESVLARRPIKGLPKRSLAGAANASATPVNSTTSEAAPAPGKFAGFTGFGSGATTSTPFSFAASPPQPAPSASAASPFLFSATTSSTSFAPPVSSNASAATKAFASIVSSSSTSSAPTSTSSAPTSTTSSDSMQKADEKEVDYYKAIRGLNVSLLSAISKAIEADPFADVADMLERYKALRVSVDASREDKSTSASAPSSAPSTKSAPSDSMFKSTEASTKPPSAPSFTMPAPPVSFSGFKPLVAPTSSGSSTSSGFAPKSDTSSSSTLASPFSFSSKPATSEPPASDAPKSNFSFGGSFTAPTTGSSAPSPFSFGAPSSGSSLFGKGPTSSTSSGPTSFFGPSSSSSSIFGGNTFGKPSDTTKEKEADKPEEKDASASTTTTSSSGGFFGSSSTGSNPFATSTPEKSASSNPFSFGSASPAKANLFSGFPKAGSIGNPVGFGFGSPPKTPDAETGSGPVKSLPFAFGAPKPAAESNGSGAEEKTEKEGEGSGESTPAAAEGSDAPQGLPASTSVHDMEGEGEEDEVTTHEIRSKVYKMVKDKDGKASWGDLGVGVLRLKKHKETDARRMLLRNSSTGKITINFILYSGMNASVSDKVVSFIGHEDGQSTPYRIRTKTAEQANALKAALDREIEFVRAKSETQ
ncbi:hypothetical protein C8Q70DRAFT_932300 [Cubamyces menziesii]|uniref:RanBD1 domain-containing protein n=1 Tax=Trametes cubensis TaxID=1111947 RepID=A0AAD7TMP3_9APHY|nr:hypothetical protein C8Q70DRAFT_932300 [Cubamyces menziesii]KAJ8469529.1 hypothetical protein ONZ51_g8942 [Trametes cubensis]